MNRFQSFACRLTLVAVTVGTTWQALANPRHDPANPGFPKLSLTGIQNGEAAVAALGQNLPAVALSYGHTPDELRGFLHSDPTLHVDEHGRLLYLEPGLPLADGTVAPASTVTAAAAPYPLANTFLLHSKPGSKRVIYLDFDGHVLTGTAWNTGTVPSTLNCPPWDIDGDPTTFSDAERTIIQGIWQRVSQDYLPFDVDVTTEYPGEPAMTRTDLSDDTFGVRVLISPISNYFGNYGGIAYVGVFDYTSDYYKPALVFPEMLSNGEKYIAEAIAHEAGHTLGLSHDGTTTGSAYYGGSGSGETGWAPIMGVGYYENLTQWSKGEYANANNTEDDLVVMQNNGISYRADDYGNSIATATMLPVGSSLSISGIIEQNTDVDFFGFVTGAGTITLNVNPAPNGADLDILANLYDSTGVQIATSNPYGYLAASITVTVPAGTYYLSVRGTGQGDPLTGYSNYASLGAYTVNGTVIPFSGNLPPLANLSATHTSGAPWLDVAFDGSGSSDPEGGTLTYSWDFGDQTAPGTGAILNHVYYFSGTYTATLTVQDPGGLTASATTPILVNNPPTAVISVNSSTGAAPLTVNFSGSNSSDPEGPLAAYQWDFGDGTSATGVTATHTYNSTGNYTAKLTVTDSQGSIGTATIPITVQANLATVLHVKSIALTTTSSSGSILATAKVTVVNGNGLPVSGVTVIGNWSGAVTGSSSGSTDATGTASLFSKKYKKAGSVGFTVTSVSKSGYTYNSSQNLLTKTSLP